MIRFSRVRGAAAIPGCLLAIALSWWMLAGVAQAAPTNNTKPSITGILEAGQTLTVNPGTWTPDPLAIPQAISGYSYAWTSGGIAVGSDSTTYPVATTDIGKAIAVTVTATDSTGSTAAAPVSAGTVPAPPQNSVAPAITGIVQEGQTLTAGTGTWSGTAPITYSYAWTSGGSPVGTNSSTYTVATTDVGKTIAVSVSASGPGGIGGPVPSAATTPVLPLPPANAGIPTISGPAQQGQTLTVTHGTWTNPPLTAINDQWEQCSPLGGGCTAIPGQTGNTYTLGPGDVGHTIAVAETASNAGGSVLVAAVSPGTAAVTATSVTSIVAFSSNSPTANQTVTLVATVTSSSGNASPHGSMTFFNGSNGISGCSGKGVNGGQTVTVICPASFPAGTAQVSAAYAPDASSLVVSSTSAPTTVTVGRDGTSISLAVTNTVALGGQATYAATVVLPGSNSGPTEPSGSIEFLDRGQPIGSCLSQPLSNLTATCTVKYTARGTHDISAIYNGDANFTAATSSASAVQVVRASNPNAVLGVVASTLQWGFYYHPTYTTLLLLKAFAIGKGMTVVVTCHGKGCPYATMRRKGPTRSALSLVPRNHHPHLRPGARITVRLTHRSWVGKYYSFTIRKSRAPLIKVSCLAPGKTRPGVGC